MWKRLIFLFKNQVLIFKASPGHLFIWLNIAYLIKVNQFFQKRNVPIHRDFTSKLLLSIAPNT